MGKLEGKIAYITGAARGQGRSHAVALANEGADIIGIDICENVETQECKGSTRDDLAETVSLVKAAGRRMIAKTTDVRDLKAQESCVQAGLEAFGRLDIVVANAGIWSSAPTWELTEEQWDTMIDVNLSGVWRTVRATVPTLRDQGCGGSVILVSSICGLAGFSALAHYVAAKHGVIGLMKVLAQELGPHSIRVNAVCPTSVNTDMFNSAAQMKQLFLGREDGGEISETDFLQAASGLHALPMPYVQPADVSRAIVYLASDDGRYITGSPFHINGGALVKVT